MVRAQLQFTEEHLKSLQQEAAARGISLAELVRQSTEAFLARQSPDSRASRIERARAAAGRFASGAHDISRNHDRFLTDAFQA